MLHVGCLYSEVLDTGVMAHWRFWSDYRLLEACNGLTGCVES